MSRAKISCKTARGQAKLAAILGFMESNGPATALQLCKSVGGDAGTISRYLTHLRDLGQVILYRPHSTNAARKQLALYALANYDPDAEPKTAADIWAESPPAARTIKNWKKGQAVRDPLVSALFGSSNARST